MSTYFTSGYAVADVTDTPIRVATGPEQVRLDLLAADAVDWDYVDVKFYDNSEDTTYTLIKNKAINVGATYKFPVPLNLELDDVLFITGVSGARTAGFTRIAKYDSPESFVLKAQGEVITDNNWVILDSCPATKTALACVVLCNNGGSTVNYDIEVYDFDLLTFRPIRAVETEIVASDTHTIESIPMKNLDYVRVRLKSGQTGDLHAYIATQVYG